MGWVCYRETHVCAGHGFEARATAAVFFPGIGEGLTEQAEPFASYRRQQGLLVGKMPI